MYKPNTAPYKEVLFFNYEVFETSCRITLTDNSCGKKS